VKLRLKLSRVRGDLVRFEVFFEKEWSISGRTGSMVMGNHNVKAYLMQLFPDAARKSFALI